MIYFIKRPTTSSLNPKLDLISIRVRTNLARRPQLNESEVKIALDLSISTGADSENVSFSWGLLAKLVLTLIEIKSNLGFRLDVVGLLSEFIKQWNIVS